MKKYPEQKNQNPKDLLDEILGYWDKNQIFKKSLETRSKNFTFYEGPPGANGKPGIHHVLSRAIKDIINRYKTLKGYRVERKAGWDTHGLPVELAVEKNLGITKDDIGKKISVEEYNQECKKAVMAYKSTWDEVTKKIGYWVDLENPYITFDNDYIESVWNILKTLYDKDLIYNGYNIQPYSPAAGTGLSSHELNIPGCYKTVKDTSIVAQFKSTEENEYFLAWTTTPWTLPANSALAIGKNIEYSKIETFNPYTYLPVNVILASAAVPRYFNLEKEVSQGPLSLDHNVKHNIKTIPWKKVSTHKGKELIGKKYHQLLEYVIPEGKAFEIIEGDFISTEDGTGIVHISPTFGADDMKAAQKAGISSILVDRDGKQAPIVDKQGKFVSEVTDFAGQYVKEEYETDEVKNQNDYQTVDVKIAIKLKKENKAFLVEKYEHSYPHCWRTDKPILYYPLDSWFIRTTDYKQKLIDLNKTINWYPEHVGSGRFGNWLENLVDWNLSRDRFWGIPLPIWTTEDGKESKCIGSLEELKKEVQISIEKEYMKEQISEGFDLHKPYVDNIILTSKNGEKMHRETSVIDVWFDSGAMPYAQHHYPFENKDKFNNQFPADFIAEGVDQTRGWFFTLHAISVLLSDSIAFKNVLVNGLVLDKNGNKMSKRLGNSVDPLEIIEKYGPDPLRWYMVSSSNPWENLKFDIEELEKANRRFFGTFENTYNFFALYANIDGYTPEKEIPFERLQEIDRWIISRLNNLILSVDNYLSKYDITKAAREIQDFLIDDLSNWYVRLNRKRYWNSENNIDKESAYQTLYRCILTVTKLLSPISPFYTEKIYQNLKNKTEEKESVHLVDFPESNKEEIDIELEEKMSKAQIISSLVHSIRKNTRIKVRQPLSKILIPVINDTQKREIEYVKSMILNETNVKEIEFLDAKQNIISKKAKPNFKKLGKIYGKDMKTIAEAISRMTQEEILEFEKNKKISIKIANELEQVDFGEEDIEITFDDIPGWTIASSDNITIALDTNITEELELEGISRELVNRFQNLRKDIGLDIQDKINIRLKTSDDKIRSSIERHMDYITKETQAKKIEFKDTISNPIDIIIEDSKIETEMEKVI